MLELLKTPEEIDAYFKENHPANLRKELYDQLITIASTFDSLDHAHGPMGGTIIQEDCLVIRALADNLIRSGQPEEAMRPEQDASRLRLLPPPSGS